MGKRVTIREIAEQTGKSKRTIERYCESQNWPAIAYRNVSGNQTAEYDLSVLPAEIQQAFASAKRQGTVVKLVQHQPAPAAAAPVPAVIETAAEPPAAVEVPQSLQPVKKSKSIVALTTQAPDRAKKVALAKYDLLVQVEKYCRLHSDINRTEAINEFLEAYNNGLMLVEINKIVGETSISSLYHWKRELGESEDYTRLIPRWFGHGAGTKIPEHLKDLFLSALLKPNKLKVGTAFRLAKFKLEKDGARINVSEATVRRFVDEFRQKHEDIWIFMREGKKALNDTMLPYIKRDASALEVGECLVADGHTMNVMAINPWTGKAARPTLIAYIDWKSGCLAGYEIMFDADTQAVCSALRNAILYMGKVPEFAYQDNGKEFKNRFFNGLPDFEETGMTGLFARIGVKAIYAQPYNAQAKIIERFFREFNETFERLMPSYSGASIEDRPAHYRRNEKFHKSNYSSNVPNIGELIDAIEAWREFQQAQPCTNVAGKTIGQVFNEGLGAGVDENELDDLLMVAKKAKIYRNGIKLFGSDYWNEELYGLTRDSETTIKYSLFDLSKIRVYDEDGRLICEARRVEAIHPLAAYKGAAQDHEALKVQIKQKKHHEKLTRQAAQGIINMQRSNMLIDYAEKEEPPAAETQNTVRIVGVAKKKAAPAAAKPSKKLFAYEWEKEEWEAEQKRKVM